jgi:hypothetical protein
MPLVFGLQVVVFGQEFHSFGLQRRVFEDQLLVLSHSPFLEGNELLFVHGESGFILFDEFGPKVHEVLLKLTLEVVLVVNFHSFSLVVYGSKWL